MVEACKQIIPVFVDCDWGKKNKDVSGKYGVRGYPTVVFTDSDGNEVDRMKGRDAQAIVAQINTLAEKHTKSANWIDDYDKGMETGSGEDKPVLVYFTDGKKDCKLTEMSFIDKDLRELSEQFVMIRHTVEKKCELCKKYRMTRGPNMIIVNPHDENPEAKPLSKISGRKGPKSLISSLKSALKKWEKIKEEKDK